MASDLSEDSASLAQSELMRRKPNAAEWVPYAPPTLPQQAASVSLSQPQPLEAHSAGLRSCTTAQPLPLPILLPEGTPNSDLSPVNLYAGPPSWGIRLQHSPSLFCCQREREERRDESRGTVRGRKHSLTHKTLCFSFQCVSISTYRLHIGLSGFLFLRQGLDL